MPINAPTDITGCMLWLDAADPTTLFQDFAGTIPSVNGAPVRLWRDKTVNLNHFSNNNSPLSTVPILSTVDMQNNLSAVSFPAPSLTATTFTCFLTGNVTNFRYLTGGATIFSVCQPLSAAGQEVDSASHWCFGNIGGTAGGGFAASRGIFFGTSPTTFLTNESVTIAHESSTATTGRLGASTYARYRNTSEILTLTVSNTGTVLYQNSRIVPLNLNSGINTLTNSSPSAAGVTTSDNIVLNGGRSSGRIAPGPQNNWQEFIIYNRVLSQSERIDVEYYIKTKWNLSDPVYNAYAKQSDLWSKPTTWLNDTLPTSASNVWSNGFTVELDIDATAQSLRTSLNGGGFNVYSPITIRLLGEGIVPGNITAVTCFTGGTDTFTVIGTIRGGTSSSSYGIFNSEAGIVRCITTQGVIGDTGIGIYNSSAGAVYVVGPVYGAATASNGYGIYNAISGYINVVGSIYGGNGSNSHGVYLEPSTDLAGVLRVTGDVFAGTQSNGIAGANPWADIQLNSKFTANRVNGRQATSLARFLLNPKPYASFTRFALNASEFVGYSGVDDYTIYLHPEAKDVQLGVTYGALTLSGIPVQLIGTMGVPDRTAVSYNTPVGNTLGVGIIGVESLRSAWSTPIVNMKIKDTIGRRAVATATIPEFGDLLRKINV